MRKTPALRLTQRSAGLPAEEFIPVNPYDPHCFMICPFAPNDAGEGQGAVEEVARSFGFGCYRADERYASTDIVERVREAIAGATFVVADLTDTKPNCFYEIGFADALKRPLILVARLGTQVPFDVKGRSILFYRDGADLRAQLRKWVLDGVLFSHGPECDEDRNRGAFGRLAFRNGYLLSGYMTFDLAHLTPETKQSFHVYLNVRSACRPVEGKVCFNHDPSTFRKKWKRVVARDGIAKHDFWSYGAFTVGVEVESDGTRLELDLRYLPGSSDAFRAL